MIKIVIIDKRAEKELKKFNKSTVLKFYEIFDVLEKEGKIELPEGKKISKNLFEIRIKTD